MSEQIAVKNIKYAFDDSPTFQRVKEIAVQTVMEQYEDEQNFQKEEFEAMLADGKVTDYAEYCDAVGIRPSDVDYRKPFADNLSHPYIQKELSELQEKYMCNVYDLPSETIVTISDSALRALGGRDISGSNSAVWKPLAHDALLKELGAGALKEKFGVAATALDGTFRKADEKDIVLQNAYEKVGEMMKSNDFKRYLDLRANLERYSTNNISLVYSQSPDAKAIFGRRAWETYDRHIRPGQEANGISIRRPCTMELKTKKDVDYYIRKQRYLDGGYNEKKEKELKEKLIQKIKNKKDGEKIEVCVGFGWTEVFDISQTVPNNRMYDTAMDIINLNKPLRQGLENYDEVVKCMNNAAIIPFHITHGLSQQDALFDAVLNYADALLTNAPDKVEGIKSPTPFVGDRHTVETFMSAYLICAHIGIECAEKVCFKLTAIFSSNELTEQSVKFGKREMFKESFDRACHVADQFNKAFDKSFGFSLEAQRKAITKQVEERIKREEAERKAKALSRIYFGKKTPMQKHDVWVKNGNKYIVAQSEEDNAFYVKVVLDTKHISFKYLKNDEGKAKSFDSPPSRETVEKLFEKQAAEHKDKPKQTDGRDV